MLWLFLSHSLALAAGFVLCAALSHGRDDR